MAVKNSGDAQLQLRTLFNVGAIGALSDGQLLERFTTGRGEPRELAFAALVERHGPIVMRVCRSVLHDENAAEDAFQATFLALARKAGSLWAQDSLAPWLHQAAYRAAVHDRSATIRRRSHEHRVAALRPASMAPPQNGKDVDLEKIIHEEIDRLPGRFRVAVVLCDLEGRTHEQAARHLGCAVGTVKSRLARGRKRLRGRLVRRGVAPAIALTAASAGGAARAALPTGLAESTVVYAATASAVPTSVAVITEGVLKSMFLSKVKLVMTVAAVVAALAAGAIALAQSGIGRPKDGSGNRNAAKSSGATSPRSENEQKRRKIVLTSPKATDVAVTRQYVCQIHAQRHINIRALEKGSLAEIKVTEGEAVKKGDLMFTIVPTPNKANPDAESVNVRAPFEGIVDRLHEQLGSLIKEGDILTTLTDSSVMWVYFNVSERQYLEYMANAKQHEEDKIELLLANQTKFPQPGKMSAIEGHFSNETGNIAFRADFPNPDRLLRHGQTGTIVIHRKVHDATVIPMQATFENMDKRFVYVVDEDDVVHRREILVENELDDMFLIKKGVGVGDRIVLEGIRQLRDGEKVEYEFRRPEEVLRKLKDHAE